MKQQGRIDKLELSRLLREGKRVKDIAKYFGVTTGAVSQAKKVLNLNVVKTVGLEAAHQVVARNLDVFSNLERINQEAHKILNELSGSGDQTDKKIILRACGEILRQIDTQMSILKSMHDVEETRRFQETVLEIISEVDREVRDRIVYRLKEQQALRGTLKLD